MSTIIQWLDNFIDALLEPLNIDELGDYDEHQ